jgi:hypothetical protein
VNTLLLFLAAACAPGQATAGAGGNQPETPPYRPFATPVGIVSGDPMFGLAYAWTGWPGPPAVKPPGFCARFHACLWHKPIVLPPPPLVVLPSYKARPTEPERKANGASKEEKSPKDG